MKTGPERYNGVTAIAWRLVMDTETQATGQSAIRRWERASERETKFTYLKIHLCMQFRELLR